MLLRRSGCFCCDVYKQSLNKEISLYIGIELLGNRVSETECAVLIAYKD